MVDYRPMVDNIDPLASLFIANLGDGYVDKNIIFSGGKVGDEWYKPWLRGSEKDAFLARSRKF